MLQQVSTSAFRPDAQNAECRFALANLNHPIAGFEGSRDPRPKAAELCKQVSGPAISQANPYQPACLWVPVRQVKEILVFSDHDSAAVTRIPPDIDVRRLTEPGLHDVDAIAAQRGKEPGQRSGELVVNEESHEVARTM